MKQDLREALPKVRNPPSFTLMKEKKKGGFVKPAPGMTGLQLSLAASHPFQVALVANISCFKIFKSEID